MLDAFNCGPKIKFASNDDVREAERKKLQNEVLPSLYAFLEQKLKDNNGKYFVGSKPSLADMFFSVTVKFLSDAGGVDQEKALANFPQIKTLNDMIGNCPKMAKYLAERPKCDV
jgi:glutathione S-transferase